MKASFDTQHYNVLGFPPIEAIVFSCFVKMMDQLMENFPPSEGIQKKQNNVTNLTQVQYVIRWDTVYILITLIGV